MFLVERVLVCVCAKRTCVCVRAFLYGGMGNMSAGAREHRCVCAGVHMCLCVRASASVHACRDRARERMRVSMYVLVFEHAHANWVKLQGLTTCNAWTLLCLVRHLDSRFLNKADPCHNKLGFAYHHEPMAPDAPAGLQDLQLPHIMFSYSLTPRCS